jgi:hypothetical protein
VFPREFLKGIGWFFALAALGFLTMVGAVVWLCVYLIQHLNVEWLK